MSFLFCKLIDIRYEHFPTMTGQELCEVLNLLSEYEKYTDAKLILIMQDYSNRR